MCVMVLNWIRVVVINRSIHLSFFFSFKKTNTIRRAQKEGMEDYSKSKRRAGGKTVLEYGEDDSRWSPIPYHPQSTCVMGDVYIVLADSIVCVCVAGFYAQISTKDKTNTSSLRTALVQTGPVPW